MQRRRLLQLGIAGAGIAGGGLLAHRFLPPTPSTHLRAPREIAAELAASLNDDLREQLLVDYNHPYRQYHNRGVWAGGPTIATAGFSREQLQLVTDLMYAGLSSEGRAILPNQLLLKLPDVLINNLLICGDPGSEHCQILFSGPHLNLRIGGRNPEGVAFGGPQVYGDQRGNEEPGLPGNVYRPQFLAGMALYDSLSTTQRDQALLPTSPVQTQIEVQGARGHLPGLAATELSPAQRSQVQQIIDLTLAPYPATDVAYARECIAANGGLDRFHVSFYEDSAYDGTPAYQTYRLESPAAVFYFRGYPHVHAFFNVAMDGEAPLSVGDVVGRNPELLEGAGLKYLFERAMQQQTGADLAFYNVDSVVGRLRAGTIRTGDLYNAESWQNTVVQVAVKGADITGELRADLEARSEPVDAARTYRIATTDFVADELLESAVGTGSRIAEGEQLRDQVIRYAAGHGFA